MNDCSNPNCIKSNKELIEIIKKLKIRLDSLDKIIIEELKRG